jgi:hypothetical protein
MVIIIYVYLIVNIEKMMIVFIQNFTMGIFQMILQMIMVFGVHIHKIQVIVGEMMVIM